MPSKKTSPSWNTEEKAIKRIQLQFTFSVLANRQLKIDAAKSGLKPSDLVRKKLDLPYSNSGRERIGVSFSDQEFAILATRYNIDVNDKEDIKRCIKLEMNNEYSKSEDE